MANELVLGDDGVALAALDGDGGDFLVELASHLRGFRLVLRRYGERVLFLARNAVLGGDVLGRLAHVVVVEGVPQAVLDHGVDQAEVAHLLARTDIGGMRGQRHAFLAAGDDNVAVAQRHLLRPQRHRAQARTADLVDRPGRRTDAEARLDRRLARRALPLRRLQHLAQDHFVDVGGVDAGSFQRRLDGVGAQLMTRQGRQRTQERTDRRAGGGDNDDFVGHGKTPDRGEA